MPLLIDNFQWMAWNIFLALIPILLAYITAKYYKNFSGFIFFLLWFLFFPNTIYLITDLEYLPQQLSKINFLFDIILILQYLILSLLGVLTYLYAIKPIAKKFTNFNNLIFIFNFLVAFAVALGKVQRSQSWQIFTNPKSVIMNIQIALSTHQIIAFTILFGILINFIWFFAKEKLRDLPFHP